MNRKEIFLRLQRRRRREKMAILCLSSLSVGVVPVSPFGARLSLSQTQLTNPILSSHNASTSNTFNSKAISDRIVVSARSSSDQNDGGSPFMDENGVVDDMDGYLNYLSLEYDSVWDTKPSWCQPWTITLTGVSAIALSWLVLQSVILTTLVTVLTFAWWYLFLYSYPKAYEDMIAERRKKVTNGVEDTFGLTKSQ